MVKLPDESTDPRLEELVRVARSARQRAYVPYSGFTVGAAVLADGRVFEGANVENSSYSVTMCAERVAAAQAIVAGHRDLLAVAVAGPNPEPLTPCGACRQFLSEFNPEMTVVCEGTSGERLISSIRRLLPEAFGPSSLR